MNNLINLQRSFFHTHATYDIKFRLAQLKKLKNILKANEDALYHAIYSDMKKSSYETYISELAQVYHEINMACRKMKKWSKIRKVKTGLLNFPARSYIAPVPLGVVLIIGSWNFPYQLSLLPALSALAAGNTVVLKPSELPEQTSHILADLVNANFEPEYFKVIEGGISETTELLNQKFDKIFFTGSVAVGKVVYQAAAKNLTPVTLELGGKNPAIFTENCNLKTGVKRLVWAKFLNTGHSCLAPDYVLVHKSLKEEFLRLAVSEIEKSRYSTENNNYMQTISIKHVQRLTGFIDKGKIFYGGNFNLEERIIEPTVLTNIGFDDKIMQEEIFGPILPVIEYNNIGDVFAYLKSKPKPLAAYLYTNDNKIKHKFIVEIPFGGGAINDSIMHFINSNLPFGGVGESGIGSYHGEFGFRTFSHYKSILDKPSRFEPSIKYSPYSNTKLKIIKFLME